MTDLKSVDAGDLSIAYHDLGDPGGQPVVLLHGFPYDVRAYDEVAALLAATHNDAYNALVCVEYAPELGRSRVFQLSGFDGKTAEAVTDEDPRAIVYTARGRTLIRKGRGYEGLARDWWQGWTFRATRLTESYTLEDCMAEPDSAGDIVLAQSPNGKLHLLGSGKPLPDTPGTLLIRFAPPDAGAQ